MTLPMPHLPLPMLPLPLPLQMALVMALLVLVLPQVLALVQMPLEGGAGTKGGALDELDGTIGGALDTFKTLILLKWTPVSSTSSALALGYLTVYVGCCSSPCLLPLELRAMIARRRAAGQSAVATFTTWPVSK